MPTRIDATAESGILVVHDAEASLPIVARDSMDPLEREAVAGKVFFLAADDPVRLRIDLYIEETPPPDLELDFQPLGGSFLLDVPSGRLVAGGYVADVTANKTTVGLPRGAYLLTLMERRPFDGRRHESEMTTVVGEADWRFSKRTTWLGLLGCFPTLFALGSLIVALRQGQWRGFLYLALPLTVLAWAPHVLMRNSPRYRRIDGLTKEHEAAKPHYILRLSATERRSVLSGGFVNI